MRKEIMYCSMPYAQIYAKIFTEAHSGAYVSYLRGERCQTDKLFFNEISASFQFPPYFGKNWNALNDCLTDLEWLCFRKVFLVFDNFSQSFSGDDEGRALVLRSLNFMVDAWEKQNVEVEVWLNN